MKSKPIPLHRMSRGSETYSPISPTPLRRETRAMKPKPIPPYLPHHEAKTYSPISPTP